MFGWSNTAWLESIGCRMMTPHLQSRIQLWLISCDTFQYVHASLFLSTTMSISRITPSLIAASNENTVALVNVNADFSLIKLEAPNEFKDLGRSLTHHRRELAEEGAVHRTACRLGALFESIAPLSPLVIKAYGARVSEISRSHTNENSATRHGVFADCIGMDGTSVWAAATSGKSAITVHLLACMLARAWSGSQATSIWVEIVEARRQELRKQIHEGI